MPRTSYRVRQRLALRRSRIHGRGVFAREFIPAGTRLIEYRGERITPAEADARYPYDPSAPLHTFRFKLDEETVVDGGVRGNMARWINHSCDPNCDARIEGGHIYIDAIRDVRPGEEITFDYRLVSSNPDAARDPRYACACGAAACRGTLLAETKR